MHVRLNADDHDGHMHATLTDCSSVHLVSHFHKIYVQNDIALSPAITDIDIECRYFFFKERQITILPIYVED